ncbi:MAG: hypothetical protein ACK2UH_09385 [Candidatus Promineifilaceae bacterium]
MHCRVAKRRIPEAESSRTDQLAGVMREARLERQLRARLPGIFRSLTTAIIVDLGVGVTILDWFQP